MSTTNGGTNPIVSVAGGGGRKRKLGSRARSTTFERAAEMSNTDEIKPVVDEAPAKGLGQTTFLGYCVPGSSYVLHTTEGPQPLPKALLANLQAAVLVAMVSLSLSIGLGIASNSGPIEGLRTAIWGGIVSGCVAAPRALSRAAADLRGPAMRAEFSDPLRGTSSAPQAP